MAAAVFSPEGLHVEFGNIIRTAAKDLHKLRETPTFSNNVKERASAEGLILCYLYELGEVLKQAALAELPTEPDKQDLKFLTWIITNAPGAIEALASDLGYQVVELPIEKGKNLKLKPLRAAVQA